MLFALTLSGACALTFQMVWLREFRLIFGGTTAASAVVLAIFMGGLGVGSALWGKLLNRSTSPLLHYGLLEIGISIAALLSPLLLGIAESIYFSLGGIATLGAGAAFGIRLLLAVMVLGTPTFLMGGTLPIAARVVTRDDDRERRSVGWLYSFNTVGAVLGAAVATFGLIESLGARGALFLAAAINLAIGSWALVWSRKMTAVDDLRSQRSDGANHSTEPTALDLGQAHDEPFESQAAFPPSSSNRLRPLLLYAAAFLVGCIFFSMEMVWSRMLGPLLGGTTYTFGLILCVALSGIGLGGALYSALARRVSIELSLLGVTCALEALFLVAPWALGDHLAMGVLAQQEIEATTFFQQVARWTQVALFVVGLPALVAGFQFPLLVALAGQGAASVTRQVGALGAWNTLGAITGALLGGLVLLPLISAAGLWMWGVIALCALALVFALTNLKAQRNLGIASLIFVGLSLGALMREGPTAVWRHSGIGARRAAFEGGDKNDERNFFHAIRRQLLWEAEGREASVALQASDSLSFIVNGKSDGNAVSDAATQIGLGILGPMLHKQAEHCLVIGLGTGESAGWLADVESVQSVAAVEMEPVIVRVAQACAVVNRDVLTNSKVTLIDNDAREHLLTTRDRYDLIVSEPSNPYRAGIANLYTTDFYLAARDRLNDDGLFLQWLQGYEVDERTVQIVLRTLQRVFPRLQVWMTTPGDMIIVCGKQAEALDWDVETLRAKSKQPVIAEGLLKAWRVSDVEGVAAHYLGDDRSLNDWIQASGNEINTDDLNHLEYAFARSVGQTTLFSTLSLPTPQTKDDPFAALDQALLARRRLALRGWLSKALAPEAIEMLNASGIGQLYLPQTQWTAQRLEALESRFPIASRCPIEMLAIAQARAFGGQALSDQELAALQQMAPLDALALESLAAHRRGEFEQAWSLLRQMLERLQRDPWADERLLKAAFEVLADLSTWQPGKESEAFELLAEPFAVYRMEELRRFTRLVLSESLTPTDRLAALDQLEPFVPWRQWVLKLRWETYEELGDARAGQARGDWELFFRQAPR